MELIRMNITEKYRPKDFKEVIGQDSAVKSLEKNLMNHSTFLLSGPSGTGKTTLARICADATDTGELDLIEIDAASFSGVDEMRKITSKQEAYPLGGGSRTFIIDECQRLTKQAWDVMLKAIEDPPERTRWFLCTTEVSKVPSTIRTRCQELKLKAVPQSTLAELLRDIAGKEKWDVDEQAMNLIACSSGGSPRRAVLLLQQARELDLDGIEELLAEEQGIPGGYELAKALMGNGTLKDCMELCKEMVGESPEAIRQTVRAYFTTVVMNNPMNTKAKQVLHAFEKPAIEQNRITDIVMRLMLIFKWRTGNG